MPTSYLFITPYLNGEEAWSGLQVGLADGDVLTPEQSASVAEHPATPALLKRFNWLLGISPAQAGISDRWPAERTILLVRRPEESKLEAWQQGLYQLREKQFPLALSVAPDADFPPTDGPWNYLSLSISHARTLPAYQLTRATAESPLIISEAKSRNDFTWAADHGAGLISGEYLLARGTPSHRSDMTRLKLLELLSLIVQDADTREMEEVFKQEPKLSYSLLRLVNSAALSSSHGHVTSFVQAINLMGRKQLQRWLQLLIYADPNNGQAPTPLLKQAACRGRMMEILAGPLVTDLEHPGDAAFMVGTFSLLDVLLRLPIAEIVGQLPLASAIKEALTTHEGSLGKLLTAIDTAERRDLPGATAALAALGISPAAYLDAQLTALDWASRLDSPS